MNSSNIGQQQEQVTENHSNLTTVLKHENIDGKTFKPIPGSDLIAFLEGGYDTSYKTMNLWQPSSHSIIKLKYERAGEDRHNLESFCVSHDGKYLMAAVGYRKVTSRSFLSRKVTYRRCSDILVWNLQNSSLEPIHRIALGINSEKYHCEQCIISENNTLIMHYLACEDDDFHSIIVTLGIENNGMLHLLNQFPLRNVFYTALTPSGLIISINKESGATNIHHSNGKQLHTHNLKNRGGELKESVESLKNDYLGRVSLIDKNTIALTGYDQSMYIVDITSPDHFKQLCYIEGVKFLKDKYAHTSIYPMTIETGLVAIYQQNNLYFFDLKQNQILSKCQLDFGNYLRKFDGTLENGYLIGSNFERNENNEKVCSLSIRTIDLFAAATATAILYNDLQLPRDIAALAASYLHSNFRHLRSSSVEKCSHYSMFNPKKRKPEDSQDNIFNHKKIKTNDAMTDDNTNSHLSKTEERLCVIM